jgi:hypothetical protein
MTNIICDMCKKSIPAAKRRYTWKTRNNRYDTILDKDLCPACLEKLEEQTKHTFESKENFGFHAYRTTYQEILKKTTK